MVESTASDEKKNLGNAEFKKGNFAAAIKYYGEALDIAPSE